MSTLLLILHLATAQMPPVAVADINGVTVAVPQEPAEMVEFGVKPQEWIQFFRDRIVPTVQTGIDKYQRALQIAKFTVADMNCLVARALQGHYANVLNSAISSDYPVPMDIMDKYYNAYANAEVNARNKCGGPGNNGQRLWAVWVQDASAAAGTRTLPAPAVVLGVDKAQVAHLLFSAIFSQHIAPTLQAANLPTSKAQALANYKQRSEEFNKWLPAFMMMYYQAKMIDIATGNPP